MTNINYFITKTGYTLGSAVDLPDFILKKRCIKPMNKNTKGRNYNDNLCMFRCLSSFLKNRDSLDEPLYVLTEQNYIKWTKLNDASEHKSKFSGIKLSDIPKFEECFSINVYVYRLLDHDKCVNVYKSLDKNTDTMYLNLYEHHMSLITDINIYARRYQCPRCDRIFPRNYNMRRHLRVYSNRTKHVYPGGFYSKNQSIFEQLEYYGIVIPKEERYYEYYLVYDFESVLKKQEVEVSDDTAYTHQHLPVAVGIASNCPGYTQGKCIIDNNPDRLIESMIEYMYKIQQCAYGMAKKKWAYVIDSLNQQIEKLKPKTENTNQIDLNKTSEEPSQTFVNHVKHKNVYSEFMNNLQNDRWGVQYNDFSNENNEFDNTDNNDSSESEDELNDEINQDESEGECTENANETESKKDFYDVNKISYRDTKNMLTKFMNYISQISCLAYNSGRYDLPLIKSLLAKHLKLGSRKTDFVIKKTSSYLCITTDRLRFLDVMSFIGGGTYSNILKKHIFFLTFTKIIERLQCSW